MCRIAAPRRLADMRSPLFFPERLPYSPGRSLKAKVLPRSRRPLSGTLHDKWLSGKHPRAAGVEWRSTSSAARDWISSDSERRRTVMTPVRRLAPALLAAFALVGCTLTRGSSVVVGTSRPAIDPSKVKLYLELPKKYEKVALLSADSRNDFASQQNLTNAAIDRLRKEAAK